MRAAAAPAVELANLFKETVALYLRLTADASAIHGLGSLSGPRRTLLVALAEAGPQTAARLARARAQSRQRLQPLINRLIADGLLEATSNPMHRRSPLLVLTPKGEAQARHVVETEAALREQLRLATPPRKLAEAAAVLREVREALEQQLGALLAKRARPTRRRTLKRS
jgi:DNA-binding MarR family transcriptional regulator